jgi:type IV pilus assembly protein PilB
VSDVAEGLALFEAEREADDIIVRRLAQRLGLTFIRDLNAYPLDADAVDLVPGKVIERARVVPLGFEDGVLVVATADPTNVVALDDVRLITGRELKVLVARSGEVDEAIARVSSDRSALHLLDQAEHEAPAIEEPDLDVDLETAPIVKAIDRIISNAVRQRASDIHIEPRERDVRIRYRIDGVLAEAMTTKRTLSAGITSRLKVMSSLDIAEKRLPQDGRMSVKVEGRSVDLRVATLPTAWGEKVVLRILDHSARILGLSDLGFDERDLAVYREAIARPYGAILLTGPTGAGKTSTMYATLVEMDSAERNIVTIENPVEIRLDGITQLQVDTKAGLTFANALRSILRSDPDVLMVGEMRDRETATAGIEAAQTGHLVLSTLHTNDAASAITRLVEMGVEPFLVASSLHCVVAQRLARRLCLKCREAYTPTRDQLANAGIESDIRRLFRPVGCPQCSRTGYHGRIAVLEILPITEDIRNMTVLRHGTTDIAHQAIANGMRTLRQDGIQKATAGVTSLEEVLRVTA